MSQDESRPLLPVVDRPTFDEQLEVLRAREKTHTPVKGTRSPPPAAGCRWSTSPQTVRCSGRRAQ